MKISNDNFTTANVLRFAESLQNERNIDGFMTSLNLWLPVLFNTKHFNTITGNTVCKSVVRYFSPRFPMNLFENSESAAFDEDYALKLGLTMSTGEVLHFNELTAQKNAHEGWEDFCKWLTEDIGMSDGVSIILYSDDIRKWKSGLTLYRFKPEPPFTKKEVENIKMTAPLIAASYKRILDGMYPNMIMHNVFKIQNQVGYFSFTVDENGKATFIDPKTSSILHELFESDKSAYNEKKLPQKITQAISKLINKIDSSDENNSLSEDIASDFGHHRIYISAPEDIKAGSKAFFVLFVLSPEHYSFESLKTEGATEQEVKILSCLQRGFTNSQIGSIMGITERTVRFHLNNLAEKLQASGRVEILTRAMEKNNDSVIKAKLKHSSPIG